MTLPALLLLLLGGASVPGQAPDRVAGCAAAVKQAPASLDGYQCLMAAAASGEATGVRRFLERRRRETPQDARPRLYLGLLREFAGEPVPEHEFELAASGFRREGELRGLVYALTSQAAGRCAHVACDGQADRSLTEAEMAAEGSADVHFRRLVQIQWLRVAIAQDDLERGQRAVARLEALPATDPWWLARQLFQARGDLAEGLNDLEQESAVFQEMLQASTPGSADHAVAIGGLAQATGLLAIRGRHDRLTAERLLRNALAEQRRLGLEMTVGGYGALTTSESLALLLGPGEESRTLLRSTLDALGRRPGFDTYASYAEWLLAANLMDGHPTRPAEALALADRALERARARGGLWEYGHGLLLRAYVLWRSGRRAEALTDAGAALDKLEEIRSKQADAEVRVRVEDTLVVPHELVSGLFLLEKAPSGLDREDVEQALDVMERLRSRTLLELILAREREAPEESSVRRDIASAQERLLASGSAAAERRQWVESLRGSEARLAVLRRQRTGRAAALVTVPSLREIQAALGPREGLVSFQVWTPDAHLGAPYLEGRSWATVVTRSDVRVVSLPNGDRLEAPITFFRMLMPRRDGSERAGGAALYDVLVRPAVDALPPGIEDLVLIPDGPLHQVPFDALPVSANGPYLAERFRLSLAPSAAIWLRLRKENPASVGRLALALADPATTARSLARGGAPAHALGPLPQAQVEAARVLRAFPAGSRMLVGREASKRTLLSTDLQPFGLIHFAVHSVVEPLRPADSAIVLAGENGREPELLQVAEISRLGVDGKAIVLASCSTTSGVVRRAEGVQSLARPFLAAGARAVIGNLQPVLDSESMELFDAFYSALEHGESLTEALASAKRARIAAGAPPAAWAGYVLLGDGADRLLPARAHPLPEAVAGVCLLLLGASTFLLIRRGLARRRSGR